MSGHWRPRGRVCGAGARMCGSTGTTCGVRKCSVRVRKSGQEVGGGSLLSNRRTIAVHRRTVALSFRRTTNVFLARRVTFIRSLHMAATIILRPAAVLLALCAVPVAATAQTQQDRTQDRVAFPAHKIIGNVHYVGTVTLNSYLITTPQGHILINTNYEDTVPLLRASVEKLGFTMTDIKKIGR